MVINEHLLNKYYNIGGYNKPERIGYMMKMIRDLKPLSKEEWEIWYLSNVHDANYLVKMASEMQQIIPVNYGVSKEDCLNYIYDVMFRRTFFGYNKEKQALLILRDEISPSIEEAPKEWDTEYFIDFCVRGKDNKLIGIQLKPETFYKGHYQNKVNIEGKMHRFCENENAIAFVLQYKASCDSKCISFLDPNVLDEIKGHLK